MQCLPRPHSQEAALSGISNRDSLCTALSAYHTSWLLSGAEIAVGHGPRNGESTDVYIRRHILACPTLLERHKGIRSREYWSQLGALVSKRLLLLVLLLDRAARQGRALGAPHLFRKGRPATLSSSEAVLQAALGGVLGEVDVVRRLARFGYRLEYKLQPLQEIDFRVRNLAIDMRDGLRLCRLAELLAEKPDVVRSARYPATRRTDRLHNVTAALHALKGMDVQGGTERDTCMGFTPADVVDGDREATTRLLWRLLLRYYLPKLLLAADVELEIDHVLQTTSSKVVEASDRQLLVAADLDAGLVADAGSSVSLIKAVLRWLQIVAGSYGLQVRNFERDMAEGSALCLAVHYYLGHRGLGCESQAVLRHSGREAAALHFARLRSVADSLGGIPSMCIAVGDIDAAPMQEAGALDQRAMVMFAAAMCRRLLEVNKEHRAAMLIQRRWRQYCMPHSTKERPLACLHRWIHAAEVVQRAVRTWLARRAVKQRLAERDRETQAAIVVQSAWKRMMCRKKYVECRAAAIAVQASWRTALARRAYLEATIVPAVAATALHRRAELIAAKESKLLGQREYSSTVIQACWRGYQARLAFKDQRAAIIEIQRFVRGFLARQEANARCKAVLAIQRGFRSYLQRRREATIAATKRRMAELALTMREFAVRVAAAKQIQAAWRGHQDRQIYKLLREEMEAKVLERSLREEAAREVLASWVPTFQARTWFLRARRAAPIVQAAWRRVHAARCSAALVIQRHVRAYLRAKHAEASQHAALVIQKVWRGHAVREHHMHAGELSGVRRRLLAASAAAPSTPQATLGFRVQAALHTIADALPGRLPAARVLRELIHCMEYSLQCRDVVVDAGVLPALLRKACAAGRDKTQAEPLQLSLACFTMLCRSPRHADIVFETCMTDGTLAGLVEMFAQQREREEVFSGVLRLLSAITSEPKRAQALGRDSRIVVRLEGVVRLLGHKRASAATYLTRLEKAKGSDASARQATKSLVMVEHQINSLQCVLRSMCSSDVDAVLASCGVGATMPGAGRGLNMIVREVLKEVKNVV
jgi:abnormal spindle-like microcephaly-associated protein